MGAHATELTPISWAWNFSTSQVSSWLREYIEIKPSELHAASFNPHSQGAQEILFTKEKHFYGFKVVGGGEWEEKGFFLLISEMRGFFLYGGIILCIVGGYFVFINLT